MGEDVMDPWTATMSGGERVRQVVEVLREPTPVEEIANRASVPQETAVEELERLQSTNWVTETTRNGEKAYHANAVRMLFDEVTDLIESHSRQELENQLTELEREHTELTTTYQVNSLEEFRETVVDTDLPDEDLRECRKVIATWKAVNTELRLVNHALHLYDDVVELSSSEPTSASVVW